MILFHAGRGFAFDLFGVFRSTSSRSERKHKDDAGEGRAAKPRSDDVPAESPRRERAWFFGAVMRIQAL